MFNTLVQQGLITGGYAQLAVNESYLEEKRRRTCLPIQCAGGPVLYPAQLSARLRGERQQPLHPRGARGCHLGPGNIQIAKSLNIVVTETLNLYWDLVTDNEDLKARQRTLQTAQKFFDDTKAQIRLRRCGLGWKNSAPRQN